MADGYRAGLLAARGAMTRAETAVREHRALLAELDLLIEDPRVVDVLFDRLHELELDRATARIALRAARIGNPERAPGIA